MAQGIRAGLAYSALVLGLGFALGTVRVLVLIPHFGETASVLVELPIILTASWIICRRLIRRFAISALWAPRLAMGATAFGLLIVAEAGLSVGLFGNSLIEHLLAYVSPHGAIGLAGQMFFALFPLLQLRYP